MLNRLCKFALASEIDPDLQVRIALAGTFATSAATAAAILHPGESGIDQRERHQDRDDSRAPPENLSRGDHIHIHADSPSVIVMYRSAGGFPKRWTSVLGAGQRTSTKSI